MKTLTGILTGLHAFYKDWMDASLDFGNVFGRVTEVVVQGKQLSMQKNSCEWNLCPVLCYRARNCVTYQHIWYRSGAGQSKYCPFIMIAVKKWADNAPLSTYISRICHELAACVGYSPARWM